MGSTRSTHRHSARVPTGKPDSPDAEPDAKSEAAAEAEYDETFQDWLVPSHDEKGHSERENIRFSPGMMRAMQIIVESGQTPYKTKSDLIRHAVDAHLKKLEKLQPRAGRHFLVGIRLSQQITQDEAYRQELEKLFTRLETNIGYHLKRGEKGEATRQAAMLWQQLAQVADSPWKRAAAQRFLIQHGYLLGWQMPVAELKSPTAVVEVPAEIVDAEVTEQKSGN